MKKDHIKLGAGLIGLSIALHYVHFLVFRDVHHLMIFLLADVAFIPLEVFFVSLILERIIEKQEAEKTIKKMNMLVGLFYQQFGNKLLTLFVGVDQEHVTGEDALLMNFSWEKEEYKRLRKIISNHHHQIDIGKVNLNSLLALLKENQMMITMLISNPTLNEKENFSEVLMSTFHLMEELESRDLNHLAQDDLDHLEVDCIRVYKNLSIEWVDYLEHLQKSYPYLFYTAIKTNPYDSRLV
ncbi:MAG: hypothetical protein JXO44_07210 [Clostridia bacterium]|nr:hypothetical protein [Clostridia bacterium]